MIGEVLDAYLNSFISAPYTWESNTKLLRLYQYLDLTGFNAKQVVNVNTHISKNYFTLIGVCKQVDENVIEMNAMRMVIGNKDIMSRILSYINFSISPKSLQPDNNLLTPFASIEQDLDIVGENSLSE